MIDNAEALDIHVGDVFAGVLIRREEGSRFRLAKEYIDSPSRPVLGQIFEDRPDAIYGETMGVPRWFGHLLPEGPFRRFISKALAVHEDRSFFLLRALGHDLPGAVTATPRALGADADADDLEAQPDDSVRTDDDDRFKFSLAGMQIKFSMRDSDGGLTLPMRGEAGDWIVKLADRRFLDLPENEYAMMSWAAASGINVPELQLVDSTELNGIPEFYAAIGPKAFAVKRYDRIDGGRVHAEDFAQIVNVPADRDGLGKYSRANYETIGRIVVALTGEDSLDEYIHRLLFSVIIGNGDAHLKNWSVLYPDGRTAVLTPAYDLVSTALYEDFRDDKLALNLSNSKRFADVGVRSIERLIVKAGCQVADHLPRAVENMTRILDAWANVKDQLPLKHSQVASLQARLNTLPILAAVRRSA